MIAGKIIEANVILNKNVLPIDLQAKTQKILSFIPQSLCTDFVKI